MKRALYVVLALVLMAPMFSAADEQADQDAQQAAEDTARSAAGFGAFTGDAQNKMGEMIDKFNKAVFGDESNEEPERAAVGDAAAAVPAQVETNSAAVSTGTATGGTMEGQAGAPSRQQESGQQAATPAPVQVQTNSAAVSAGTATGGTMGGQAGAPSRQQENSQQAVKPSPVRPYYNVHPVSPNAYNPYPDRK